MTSKLLGTQPEENAAHTAQKTEQNTAEYLLENKSCREYSLQEPEACYAPQTSAASPTFPNIPNLFPAPPALPDSPAEPEDQSTLTLCIQSDPCCRTRKEVMLREAPIYPEKCARWKQRRELLNKRTLNALLYQCKSVEVLAKYLNCSKQQIYAAMDYHNIPRARYSTSIRMKRSLGLRE